MSRIILLLEVNLSKNSSAVDDNYSVFMIFMIIITSFSVWKGS